MPRHVVPEAEALLDERVPVHNKGGIALVEYMGSDLAIEQAARVSFIGAKEEERTPAKRRGLIRYLMRKKHTTPFEMVDLKFWIKAPMHVWRQWIRHRTANVNEISGRYAKLPADWYVPLPQFINIQSTSSKQGRDEATVEDAEKLAAAFNAEAHGAYGAYENRLDAGMAKELARSNLPLSMYTEAIWKIDLHNLFHFLSLRADGHAQYEIRAYTDPMIEMVKALCPMAWEAFDDYVLQAVNFSRAEKALLCRMLTEGIGAVGVEDLLSTPDSREACGFARTPSESEDFMHKLTNLLSEAA